MLFFRAFKNRTEIIEPNDCIWGAWVNDIHEVDAVPGDVIAVIPAKFLTREIPKVLKKLFDQGYTWQDFPAAVATFEEFKNLPFVGFICDNGEEAVTFGAIPNVLFLPADIMSFQPVELDKMFELIKYKYS